MLPNANLWLSGLEGLGSTNISVAKVPCILCDTPRVMHSDTSYYSSLSGPPLGLPKSAQTAASSVVREPRTLPSFVSQSPITYDTDTSSLPKAQEANICSRCWPLGASELGYCICSDLALAGILPPATGQ